MNLNNVSVFILPLCHFSLEESQGFSLEELNGLSLAGKVTRYSLPDFMQDINDNLPVDNINNRIVMREELQGNSKNILKQAVCH